MQDLTGKIAIITGASSGIGEAAARLLAKEGVNVVLVARRKNRIDELAAEIGNAAIAIPTDIADMAAVKAMIAQVKNRRTERDRQEGGVQSVTVEDSMSMVHASRGFLVPPGENVRWEPWIVAGIAKATLGAKGGIDWDGYVANYDRIRDKIEAVFPTFKDYNTRIREPGGFHLPNSAAQRIWLTETKKANFMVSPDIEEDESTKDPRVMRLTTLRSHDQYNTTIYALDDRYRGVFGRRDVLFMNAKEIARLGFAEGDVIDVTTAPEFKRADRIVQGLMLVEHALPDGCCASYYPETQPLIALEDHDPQSLTPSYKSVPVHIQPAGADDGAERVIVRGGVAGRLSPFKA